MDIIKNLSSKSLNPIINQATNAALKLIDVITKAGFKDYSVPKSINKCSHIPNTKLEIIEKLNGDPTNVDLHKKLAAIYKDSFEISACNLHEEIIDMLLK